MKLAETVTFGGSALDRAAEMRGDPAALEAAAADPAARWVAVWRGKPLLESDRSRLTRLRKGEGPLAEHAGETVFLGRDGGAPVFAADVSGWEPDEVPDTLGAFVDLSEQRYPGLPGETGFAELRGAMARLTPRDAELAATAKALLGWHGGHGFCARCGAGTVVSQAGWQRTCPACGAHHFPRTDPVVIMLITRGNRVLLGRSPGWPEGMYSLLAGFVEPGETIEAAVRREVAEETGIAVGEVGYLASQPWPFPSSLMIGCRGDALGDTIRLDPAELDDARWVEREDVLEVMAGNDTSMKAARKGSIARFLLEHWLADRLD